MHKVEVCAQIDGKGNSLWTPLKDCFLKSSFESFHAGLPCISTPDSWLNAANGDGTLRRGLGCLGVACEPTVSSILKALGLRHMSSDVVLAQVLPLYAWLATAFEAHELPIAYEETQSKEHLSNEADAAWASLIDEADGHDKPYSLGSSLRIQPVDFPPLHPRARTTQHEALQLSSGSRLPRLP